MYTWKNVNYADGSGLVDSIRKGNAQMAENDQAMVDAISGFGDDYSKLQTDSATAAIMSAATPEEAKAAYNQFAANESGFINKGTLGQTLKDQNQTFRDIATHEDNLTTNALSREANQLDMDIANEQRAIKLKQLGLNADATAQEIADAQQAYDQNNLMNPERFKEIQQKNIDQKFKHDKELKVLNDEIAVSDAMGWLLDDNLYLGADGANQIRDIRQEMLANNVDPTLYNKQLAEMSIKNLVNTTGVIDNLDKASETDIVSAISKIKSDVINRFPGLSLDDAAKATSEMLIQSGVENRKGVLDAAKILKEFESKENIKQEHTKEIHEMDNKSKEAIAWVNANNSGKSSKGKNNLLDKLSKSEFATDSFLGLGDSPGTALMNKLSPMIETLYPDAKDQNKVWSYLSTSGFPTADSDMRNSYLIGGVDTASDSFNSSFFKEFINKTGILTAKDPKNKKQE